jgi:predicted Rossmann-fold nucleotide-binding protein
MYQLANVIIVLPGGVDVVGAVVEMIAWAADARPPKPIILLDDDGHFHPFVATLNHLVAEGFATAGEVSLVHHVNSTERVLELINAEFESAMSVA